MPTVVISRKADIIYREGNYRESTIKHVFILRDNTRSKYCPQWLVTNFEPSSMCVSNFDAYKVRPLLSLPSALPTKAIWKRKTAAEDMTLTMDINLNDTLKALSNPIRLNIMHWLKNPRQHFSFVSALSKPRHRDRKSVV